MPTATTTTAIDDDDDDNNNNTSSIGANDNGNDQDSVNDGEEVIVTIPENASSLTYGAYSPNPIEINIGDDTVTWINDDFTIHTARSGTPISGSTGMFGGTYDSPEIIEQDSITQSFTFDEAGEFPYYCMLHPNMIWTVRVTEE